MRTYISLNSVMSAKAMNAVIRTLAADLRNLGQDVQIDRKGETWFLRVLDTQGLDRALSKLKWKRMPYLKATVYTQNHTNPLALTEDGRLMLLGELSDVGEMLKFEQEFRATGVKVGTDVLEKAEYTDCSLLFRLRDWEAALDSAEMLKWYPYKIADNVYMLRKNERVALLLAKDKYFEMRIVATPHLRPSNLSSRQLRNAVRQMLS